MNACPCCGAPCDEQGAAACLEYVDQADAELALEQAELRLATAREEIAQMSREIRVLRRFRPPHSASAADATFASEE